MREPYQDLDTAIEERRRMRARRRRLLYLRRTLILVVAAALLALVIATPFWIINAVRDRNHTDGQESTPTVPSTTATTRPTEPPIPAVGEDTTVLNDEIDGEYAVLLDVTDGRVVAAKNADVPTNPASITKVMTLLVAVENIADLNEKFTMSWTIINPLVAQEANITGLETGESVPLRDLLYGAVLPSGADATVALATHVSGSEAAFAELMNQRAKELGCTNTHFTNTSGLHDREHKTTAMDMALMTAAAVKNDTCLEVLSTPRYTMTATDRHPDGLPLVSSLYKTTDQSVIKAGKTGYTDQARNTLVTYTVGADGHEYVYVTMGNNGHKAAMNDTFKVYKDFCGIE